MQITLTPAARDAIAARHGDAALAPLLALVPTLPRLVGAPDCDVALEGIGGVAWIEAGRPRGLTFQRHAVFFIDGRWRPLDHIEALRQAIADALPDLADWRPIAALWARFLDEEIVADEAALDDLQDPRWHVFPLDAERAALWEPPRLADGALRFVVHGRGALTSVRIDATSYAIDTVAL